MSQNITDIRDDLELVRLWMADKSATTQISYRSTVSKFLEFIGKPLADVRLEDLQLWKKGLLARFAATTVANKVLVIKSLLSFCVKVGYLTLNVGSFIKPPKTKETLAQKIVDRSSIDSLIGAVKTDRDRLLLLLMYGCGLRVSEAVGLTWADFQPYGQGGKATIFGKGSKTRVVILPPKLWMAVKEFERYHRTSQYVFVSRLLTPLRRETVHAMIKRASRLAGIDERISCHWLRHSHASHSLDAGCNLRLLQQSLGHASVTTTEKYLHISPDAGSSQFIDF